MSVHTIPCADCNGRGHLRCYTDGQRASMERERRERERAEQEHRAQYDARQKRREANWKRWREQSWIRRLFTDEPILASPFDSPFPPFRISWTHTPQGTEPCESCNGTGLCHKVVDKEEIPMQRQARISG